MGDQTRGSAPRCSAKILSDLLARSAVDRMRRFQGRNVRAFTNPSRRRETDLLIRNRDALFRREIILNDVKLETMSGFVERFLNNRLFRYAAMTLLLVALCPWLWQGVRDAYVGYSGTVVAKGNYLWVPLRGIDWYIILEDASGHRTKRYVGALGYGYCDVGSYVVKKKGLGEYPRKPGDLTPSELEEFARRRREQK
jgi:hypothetical protein